MSYLNLYHYLDTVFRDVSNPSDTEIAKAKAEYWKQYRFQHQRQRRTKIKEFTLGLDAKTMHEIHNKRNGLSVSEFLYKSVFQVLQSENGVADIKLLGCIQQQQLQIIMLLEELLDRHDSAIIESVLERMETLEVNLQNLRP